MAAAGTAAGRVLPASPNWYCSRCSDTSADGRFFGFAARHRICLLDVSSPAAPAFYGTVVKRGASLLPLTPRLASRGEGVWGGVRGDWGGSGCSRGSPRCRCRGAAGAHGQGGRLRLLPAPRARRPLRQRLRRRQRAAVGRRQPEPAGGARPAPGRS